MIFDEAIKQMGEKVERMYENISDEQRARAAEIRIRAGYPPSLTLDSGETVTFGVENVTPEQVDDAFVNLCGHSVYSHEKELSEGFVTVKGGHRAGFGGRAVYDGNRLATIRDISSVNLRIARQVVGCSDLIRRKAFEKGVCGLLLVGAPSSGKTTVLRDIARALSESGHRVTVCDERGEIAAVWGHTPQFRLGRCCDVLTGFEKRDAVIRAVRCLSPQTVICDELGNGDDAAALCEAVNAGVNVIASVHASDEKELLKRPQCLKILETGAFEKVVFLSGKHDEDKKIKIRNTGELFEDSCGADIDILRLFDGS